MFILDLILLILLGYYGIYKGIKRGFVMELSGFVGIIVAIYLAKNFSLEIAGLFASALGVQAATSPVLAFILAFVLGLVGVHFLAILISKLLNVVMLGWLNKLLGALFSLAKVLLIMSVALRSFDLFNSKVELISQETLAESRLYHPVKLVADTILPRLNMEDIINNWKANDQEKKEQATGSQPE